MSKASKGASKDASKVDDAADEARRLAVQPSDGAARRESVGHFVNDLRMPRTCRTRDWKPAKMTIAWWRPHLREPHESAERGEQRPDTNNTTGLEPEDVLEGVGLERELQAGDVVAHSSCERHVGDGVDVLEVVCHIDAPRPARRMRAGPTEQISIVS
jgi:hypothetical protein